MKERVDFILDIIFNNKDLKDIAFKRLDLECKHFNKLRSHADKIKQYIDYSRTMGSINRAEFENKYNLNNFRIREIRDYLTCELEKFEHFTYGFKTNEPDEWRLQSCLKYKGIELYYSNKYKEALGVDTYNSFQYVLANKILYCKGDYHTSFEYLK